MHPTNQDQWLAEHIPHRLRACLAELPLQNELMPANASETLRLRIRARCCDAAAWEGRMTAARWLIEFVGIAADADGNPRRPTKYGEADFSITSIRGKETDRIDLASLEARTLAKLWKGCSQASGHPTQDSDHPPVDPLALDKALRIIISHLEKTIYSASPGKLVAETLVPFPVKIAGSSNT
jgi:hypothetical protein